MPNLTNKKCVYKSCALWTEDSYSGMSVNGAQERKRGHHGQITQQKKLSQDKAHQLMEKKGFRIYLFCQIMDLPEHLGTVLALRTMDSKSIISDRDKVNAQQQWSKGIPRVELVH